MKLKTSLNHHVYEFHSIREVMAKANELKSGDCLAGIAAETALERIAARVVLSCLTVADLRNNPAIHYEDDSITRIIQDNLDETVYETMTSWSIAQLREWLLDSSTTGDMMLKAGSGLSSECIAAVCKLMGNLDLMYASNKMTITATCNTTIGERGVIASRLQPNHPIDAAMGITASILEGLSYGVGDALLGLNPAIDTVDSTIASWNVLRDAKERYDIPTQICVLSHVTTQMKALRRGAKADLCFQSLAGTQKACESFGVSTNILQEAYDLFREDGSALGPNVMYFETGQGSELSSGTHNDWDQLTMECRCYGLARQYKPFLVNTVVGFMGPEYLYDSKQLQRAGLEDVFCGHLHGLPMGCDACYTNHMPTDQNDIENLAVLLSQAGCHYFMGLPQGDDVMLMYQSNSFHDIAALREMTGMRPIPQFETWLEHKGIWVNGKLGPNAGDPTLFLID